MATGTGSKRARRSKAAPSGPSSESTQRSKRGAKSAAKPARRVSGTAARGAKASVAAPGDAQTSRRAAPSEAGSRRTAGAGASGFDPAAAFASLVPKTFDLRAASIPAERMKALQQEYVQSWQRLVSTAANHAAPGLSDRRFAHESWHDNGPFTWSAAVYLLNAEFMQKMADAVQAEPQTRDRIRFATQQWVDMLSPANFLATNPEAQLRLLETKGESLRAGLENLVATCRRGASRRPTKMPSRSGATWPPVRGRWSTRTN